MLQPGLGSVGEEKGKVADDEVVIVRPPTWRANCRRFGPGGPSTGPTSEFVAACPCPDGLMQDETQERNEAYVILHRGARSRGYKHCGRARTSEKERVRHWGELSEAASTASLLLCLPSLVCVVRPCVRTSRVRLSRPFRPSFFVGPWTSPFIDTRRCPAVQRGCSYVLTWLAGKCLEPCIGNNVAVGGAP
jgi:hypothetical protein